jgi:hypothetical protein
MTQDEIKNMIASLGNLLTVLRDADPADRAEVYRGLGLHLTYQPGETRSSPRPGQRRSCTKAKCSAREARPKSCLAYSP